MRNIYRAGIAAAALALSVPASATVTVNGPDMGPNGSFSLGFTGANVTQPTFTESFTFSTTVAGFLSAVISTTGGGANSVNDVDFSRVFVTGTGLGAGVDLVAVAGSNDINEFRAFNDVLLGIGQYTFTTTGTATGANGAYGGSLAFNAAAVPETATWGMMILGFGMIGAASRSRKVKTSVKFA
jgi:hypothetical protein